MLVCGCGNPQCEMGPKVRCYECGADTHLIEERTQARAEAFRAQERVRELEGRVLELEADLYRLECDVCESMNGAHFRLVTRIMAKREAEEKARGL